MRYALVIASMRSSARMRRGGRRGIHVTGPARSAMPRARGGWATYSTVSPASRAHVPSCQGSSALAA